jgi:hypothetical protein
MSEPLAALCVREREPERAGSMIAAVEREAQWPRTGQSGGWRRSWRPMRRAIRVDAWAPPMQPIAAAASFEC